MTAWFVQVFFMSGAALWAGLMVFLSAKGDAESAAICAGLAVFMGLLAITPASNYKEW